MILSYVLMRLKEDEQREEYVREVLLLIEKK